LTLPSDACFPRPGTRPSGHPNVTRRAFEPEFAKPQTPEQRLAWFLWQAGHHHLFLYWLVEADVFRRVTRSLEADAPGEAAHFLELATVLRWGETAAMLNCGGFPAEAYREFIRPSMEAVRPDFSARSSLEYLRLELALGEMHARLNTLAAIPPQLAVARRGFHEACRAWRDYHVQVAERLQPGSSLAVREYDRQKERGLALTFPQFVQRVIQSQEALADYDRYFGVVRAADVTPQELAETTRHVLAQVARVLALTPEPAQWLARGDRALTAFIEAAVHASDPSLVADRF
jgi:hypothetical protein